MSTIRSRGTNGSPYTTSSFSKPAHDKDLTRERIEADLAAFNKAGGRIEMLGVTPLRRKPEKAEASGEAAPAKKPGRPKQG